MGGALGPLQEWADIISHNRRPLRTGGTSVYEIDVSRLLYICGKQYSNKCSEGKMPERHALYYLASHYGSLAVYQCSHATSNDPQMMTL